MGCITSTDVHPAINDETKKSQPKSNGKVKNSKVLKLESKTNHLCGDYAQLQVAKHDLQKRQKDRQIKLFLAADLMSNQLLEEHEMLSLGARSRGTSRNTSRATSPSQNKRKFQFQEDIVTSIAPVIEDKYSRGSVRTENAEAHLSYTTEQNTETAHYVHSPNKKLKAHRQRISKKTSKEEKHFKEKKSQKEKITEGIENGNVDSGLEEELDEDENSADLN